MAGQERRVSFKDGEKGGGTKLPSAYSDWRTPPRYEIHASIGTGSYGHVVEAFDTETKKKVAIKRCNRVFEDLIDCKRILREVAILSQMSHATIVTLHDFWLPEPYESFDELYLVLEICDSDFKKLARTPVFLSELHIMTIFFNLLAGLKYLGEMGIYHRDLKPANCLVNQDCSVKICDFGLSRAVGVDQRHLGDLPSTPREDGPGASPGADGKIVVPHTKSMKRALTGHVVTRWYRAPELILLEQNYNEQIDMWSAGCILAELLGMMRANIAQPSDRGPLFPGQSCFPLSPESKKSSKYSRGNRDQLKMIFDTIGTPTPEEIQALPKDAGAYVEKQYSKRPAINLKDKFPGASDGAVDLLGRMLKFSPKARITVSDSITHAAFKQVTSQAADDLGKTRPGSGVELPFEKEPDLNEKVLRRCYLQEMKKFHPNLQIPDGLK